MPTYDYRCDSCGHTFEQVMSISQRKIPEGRCMKCNDGDVRQVIGTPYFAYDSISSPGHLKKTPGWMKDKLKTIKKEQPLATMSVPD